MAAPHPTASGILGPRDRRGQRLPRCPGCGVVAPLCLCAELPRLSTRTQVWVVMHHDESRKPTSTGRLVARCLIHSQLFIRGTLDEHPLALPPFDAARAAVLYPAPDAVMLRPELAPQIDTLIIPEGTWAQAAHARRRVAGMRNLPNVALPMGPPARFMMRTAPKPGWLSTGEAVARALGILEGESIQTQLESVLLRQLECTRLARAGVVVGSVPNR